MASVFVNKNRVTVATTSTTTAGINTSGCNFLSVLIACSSARTATLTDSQGNTWVAHSSSPQTVDSVKSYVFYVANAAVNAAHTFTVGLDASDTYYFEIKGHSGRATSLAVEGQAFNSDGAGTTAHAGGASGTITVGDDVVSYIFDNNLTSQGFNDTWTAGAGFTLAAADYAGDGRTTNTGGIQYIDNVGSTSSVTGSWTSGVSTRGGSYVMAIKPTGGASDIFFGQACL